MTLMMAVDQILLYCMFLPLNIQGYLEMQRCVSSHTPFSRSGDEARRLGASIYPSLHTRQ
jgi:hypothetical protein